MTNEADDVSWPPALFAEQLQEAGEEAVERQQRLFGQWLSSMGGTPTQGGFGPLGPMNMGAATFKARVQSGGRISIPDAEREALDIDEGDIVQAIVIPVKRGSNNE
ncbi:AbrB/MazE/SpoVT family DNA-binding domain-containing protein [Natronorarus salvus]|uniref:AbrB/MazE/SpoVT family DNA-binding domain-containing protein n=1 Tax=Natronorarus salvus TaxID=3117733 RepID=UPI002F26BAFF